MTPCWPRYEPARLYSCVIVDHGQVLAVRLAPNPQLPKKGTFWCLPGGGLEPGESIVAGLEREMIEETGIKPAIGDLLYIQQFQDEKAEYLEFIFNVTNASDYMQIDLSKTSHGTAELAEIAFVDPAATNLYPLFLRTADYRRDIQSGKTQYFNYL